MMSYSMLVDLSISLLAENIHLKADKEDLIAGQETLQKYLAIIETNGISVEKYKDSINCLEKACDELKEALKKKDAELKAVRHYYNECLKDLKKAHAEVNELTEKLECLLCHATGSKLSKSTYSLRTMESAVNDEVQECCEEARAEAIKEFAERLEANFEISSAYSFGYFKCQIDNLVKEMVGDTE